MESAANGKNLMKAALEEIYGDNAAAQEVRYEVAVEHFNGLYGPDDAFLFRMPGRVNLIGEHTDYNHGYVLPLALEHDILLLARPRPDSTVQASNVEADFRPFSFTIGRQIPPAPTGDWSNTIRGAAQALARAAGRPLSGMDGLVVGAGPFGVPRGAGLSSSSALTVLAAVALVQFNGRSMDDQALAQLCAEAEWYVGTRGGIMDHFSLLLSQRDHAMFLDCRPHPDGRYRVEHLPLPQGYRLLIADSGVKHENARGEYNHRVAACRAGVQLLRSGFPGITHLRDVQDVPWELLEPLLPEETTVAELAALEGVLGDLPGVASDTPLMVRRRCYHVWTENRRVLAAADALREGNAIRLGEHLDDGHASARDNFGVSCPELETLVGLLRELPGVLGARLTGAGWGGCAIALVEEARAGAAVQEIRRRYRTATASAATGTEQEVFSGRPGQHGGFAGRVEGLTGRFRDRSTNGAHRHREVKS